MSIRLCGLDLAWRGMQIKRFKALLNTAVIMTPLAGFVYTFLDMGVKMKLMKKTLELLREVGKGGEALTEMMHVLIRALEERDAYTKGHSERVAELAVMIGRKMGFAGKRIEKLRRGALLHDVGKIGIRDELLYKNTDLDPGERARMNQHPEKGHFLILNSHLLWDVIPIVRGHHENFDGSGYPDGLKGEEIPLEARIVSLADYFDALVTPRPYKKAFSKKRSIRYVELMSGKKFDPKVIRVFRAVVDLFYQQQIQPLSKAISNKQGLTRLPPAKREIKKGKMFLSRLKG